jgi:thiol-disulfide isomerase/thioredoxin
MVTEVAAADRGVAVSFEGEDLDGKAMSVQDFRGKPLVVVVWGSWCTPCRNEAPEVVAAAKELGSAARFVGINVRDASTTNPRAFVRSAGITYPSFFSPGGDALLAFHGKLTPRTIPSFVVLDREGRIAGSIIGQLPSTRTLVDLTQGVADETADG